MANDFYSHVTAVPADFFFNHTFYSELDTFIMVRPKACVVLSHVFRPSCVKSGRLPLDDFVTTPIEMMATLLDLMLDAISEEQSRFYQSIMSCNMLKCSELEIR